MKRSLKSSLVLFLTALTLPALVLTGCGGGGGSTPPPGNTAPVADAGTNQSATTGISVPLDGSASNDTNGDPLTYLWSVTSKPAGSAPTFSSSTAVSPTFTADVDGSYVISLVVNDGSVNSAPASVTVTATATPLNLALDQAASLAIGQPNLFSNLVNQGGAVAGDTLNQPYGNPLVYNGVLYLSDYYNHRVLGFNNVPTTDGVSANFALGQTSVTGTVNPATPSATTTKGPQTLIVDSGRLFLTDFDFNRIAIYGSVPTTGPGTATAVIGQVNLITNDVSTTAANTLIWPESIIIAGGKLIVSDSANNRVLIWNSIPLNGENADIILGQSDPNSGAINQGLPAPTAQTLNQPAGVWSDGARLVVADSANNRVLIWNTFPTLQDQAASQVLGQANFLSDTANAGLTAPTDQTLSYPYAVACKAGQLFVADQDNNRVLIWDTIPADAAAHQAAASQVLGQPTFASADPNQGLAAPTGATLNAPSGLYVYGRKLIVADALNNRYLIYNSQDTTQ